MNTNTGYSKKTLGDSYVLLSGGGHKTLSEFIGTLSYSNNKITYTKANDSTSYDLVTIPTVPEYDLYVGASNGTSTAALSTNGNVHLILKKGSNYTRYKIKGYTNISVTSTADEIKITGPNLSGYLTSADLSGYLTSLYTTGLYVGATETQENSQTSNGNTYIKLFDDNTRRANIKISGSTNVSVSSNSSGDITITGPDLSGYLNDGSLYVLKAGDTMTGVLHLMSNQYIDSYDSGALDLNNSDIYKVNSIKFADLSDTAAEGLQWYRDSTHVDSIWVKSGVIYFTPNRAWNGTGTNYTVYHSGNLPAYPTKASWNYDDVYLKLTGGTLYNTSSDTPLNIKSNGNNAYIAFQKSDGTSIGSIGVKNDNRAYFYDGSSTHKLAYYSEIPSDYLTASDLGSYLTSSDLKTYSAVLTDTNAKTTNVTGGLFYNLLEKTGDGSYSVIKSVKFVGDGTGISVSSDANGVITITNSKPDLDHNVTTSLYLGGSSSTSDVALTSNGNTYLILKEGSSYTRKQIKGYSNISVTNTTSEIKISGPDLEGINTHYTTGLYVGATEAKSNALTTNGNTYIKLFDDDSRRANIKISGSTNVSVASDSSGNITITGPNLSGYLTDLPEHSHDRLTCQGAMNPESGRTAARGGVYSYITNASYNTGTPTIYTSVIGFGKGTSGHGEIAVHWTDGTSTYTNGIWYRGLRDYQDNWYGWTKICDNHNTYISNGTITILGSSITPLTSSDLSGYLTSSDLKSYSAALTDTNAKTSDVAGGTYYNLLEKTGSGNYSVVKSIKFVAGTGISLSHTTAGELKITNSSPNSHQSLSHLMQHHTTKNEYDSVSGLRVLSISNPSSGIFTNKWGSGLLWCNYGASTPGTNDSKSWYNLLFGLTDDRLYFRTRTNNGAWTTLHEIAYITDLPTKSSWNYDDVYVKLDPGTAEQTIKSSIGTMSKGVINLWRSSGNHYTFLGFSNGTTETYLGGIGFTAQGDNCPYYLNTSGTAYPLYHSNNLPTRTFITGYTSNNKVGWWCPFATIELKNQYGSKSATLCFLKYYTNDDSNHRGGFLFINVQQLSALGNAPNISLYTIGLNPEFVKAITTLSSTSNKIDFYIKLDKYHQYYYISKINGDDIINIRDLILTLPSGTLYDCQSTIKAGTGISLSYGSDGTMTITGTDLSNYYTKTQSDGRYIPFKSGSLYLYNKGNWMKILQFKIPYNSLKASISFTWYPTECARTIWADFNINLRYDSSIAGNNKFGTNFFVNWNGTDTRTLKCVYAGTTNSISTILVWVQCTKTSYDPYGMLQIRNYSDDLTDITCGSLEYTDTEPTGIEPTVGGYVDWTRVLNKSDIVNGVGISNLQLTWTKDSVAQTPIDIDAKTLLGKGLNSTYGGILYVKDDGVMEAGRYLDFHTSSSDTRDFAVRLQVSNTTGIYTQTLPSNNGTIALTSDLSNYVKLDPGATEQTIKSSIGSLDRGIINLWRSNGNYYTFLGFSNSSSNTYLGGIGFTAQGNTTIYYRNTSGSVFPLLHPDSNGNLTITGSYYANSDIKLKNILSRENYSSNYFATLPIIKFTWNNRNDNRVHLGTIALDVEFDFPELVTKDENGYKSLDYATLGTIGVISLAKEIVELRKEINELKLKLYDNNLYN